MQNLGIKSSRANKTGNSQPTSTLHFNNRDLDYVGIVALRLT